MISRWNNRLGYNAMKGYNNDQTSPLAGEVRVSTFNVNSEGISVLGRFSTLRAVYLWQDHMLGFNVSGHIQPG